VIGLGLPNQRKKEKKEKKEKNGTGAKGLFQTFSERGLAGSARGAIPLSCHFDAGDPK